MTFMQQLEKLPEPYRTQAIENLVEDNSHIICRSISDAVIRGFNWSDTPQGLHYWADLHNRLDGGFMDFDILPSFLYKFNGGIRVSNVPRDTDISNDWCDFVNKLTEKIRNEIQTIKN